MIRVPAAFLAWMTLRRSLALLAIVGGGFAAYAWSRWRAGGLDAMGGVVMLAPFVAVVLAAPLIGLFFGYIGWVDERAWTPWQGNYHAFDDHQVRVAEARGVLWFSSADVHAALGLTPRPGSTRTLRVTEVRQDDDLGCVLSNAGLVALFGRSTDRRTLRLVAWAERDVRRPWQNRRDGARPGYATARAPSAAVEPQDRPRV